jgi:hypothetical protein
MNLRNKANIVKRVEGPEAMELIGAINQFTFLACTFFAAGPPLSLHAPALTFENLIRRLILPSKASSAAAQ